MKTLPSFFCQAAISLLFSLSPPVFAQNWMLASAPRNNWLSAASSADGNRIVVAGRATNSAGVIYSSSDAGASWRPLDPFPALPLPWSAVASSADGVKLVVITTGRTFTSTDAGTSWTPSNTSGTERSTTVASSADGVKLAVAGVGAFYDPGGIVLSSDSGKTWSPLPLLMALWSSIASSADGTKLVAVASGGQVYTSSDSGTTWKPSDAPGEAWISVASSADGAKLVAAVGGIYPAGPIYLSTNSGAGWTKSSAPSNRWASVASSADGTRLMAAGSGGIYTSANSGDTWLAATVPQASWSSVASSANGTKLVAVATSGEIYMGTDQAPELYVDHSGKEVVLWWTTNAFGYALQQNFTLADTTWLSVTNLPTVNNAQNRLILSPTNHQDFFRLKVQ